MNERDQIRVEEADFDLGREYTDMLHRAAEQGACGAVAAFVGLVRDRYGDASVSELFLEHYPGMTERSIERLVERARQRWELLQVVIVHRVGALKPTDQIVLVLTASPHRAEAFAACEFIMDYLKTDAVFWKREALGDAGPRWVESTRQDRERVANWQADPARGE